MPDPTARMGVKELIEVLKSRDLTKDELYNLVAADILDETSPGQILRSEGTVQYFRHKICDVLQPVICELRSQGGARGE